VKKEVFKAKSEKQGLKREKQKKRKEIWYKIPLLYKKRGKKFKFFLKKTLFSVKENTKQERKVSAFLRKRKGRKRMFFEEEKRKKGKMGERKYQKRGKSEENRGELHNL
jgi:hypothetical protein